MTIHLCRDLVTLPTSSSPGTSMYALAIFLYHVLGYAVIVERNFPLQSSSYEVGGDPSTFASMSGTAGHVLVTIPSASYGVSSSDVDRILALKSSAYPKANSGLFRITSASIIDNSLQIDYRSAATPPTDNLLYWRIYEAETIVANTWSSGSNLDSGSLEYSSSLRFGYTSWDAGSAGSLPAAASRIVLQSPDTSLWQVRLCLDSGYDVKSGSVPTGFTIAPGFYTSTPPYESPTNKELHGPLYYNSTSSLQLGMAVGAGPLMVNGHWTTGSWRITMVGDDDTGTCIIVNRGDTLLASGWAAFGIPEDEHLYPDIPPDDNTMRRLFTMGSAHDRGSLTWRSDFYNPTQVEPQPVNCVAWGDDERPLPAALCSYADIWNQTTHFANIATAGTTSFGGYTEVIDVEIMTGVFDNIESPNSASYLLWRRQPRRVGRFPMARQGPWNYGDWSHTPDDPGDPGAGPRWLHAERGIFLPWGGPALTGSNTGSLVWPISGSQYDEQGLLFYQGNTIGSDPSVTTQEVPHDIDATRYRKTYSFFRQPVVAVGYVKGGSNQPK